MRWKDPGEVLTDGSHRVYFSGKRSDIIKEWVS